MQNCPLQRKCSFNKHFFIKSSINKHSFNKCFFNKCFFNNRAYVPRGCLAFLFAVIFCTLSAVMGSYVYSACQKASANYTKLVSDIMLAQQAAPQLREALEEGSSRQPNNKHIEYIDHFIATSKQHLNNIQTNIERDRFLTSNVNYLINHFSELDNRLSDLNQQAYEVQQHPEFIEPLKRGAMKVGGSLAWLYGRSLHNVFATKLGDATAINRYQCATGSHNRRGDHA